MTLRIAVFASGRGSNLLSLHDAVQDGRIPGAELALVVCDRPEAPVIPKVRERGLPIFVFQSKDYPDKAGYEQVVHKQLAANEIGLIVLAGYMRLIGPTLLKPWEGRIINLHPSLLPKFPGKDAIEQAWQTGVSATGVTVHFVDFGMDSGPVIAQEQVWRSPDDTLETLAERIHQTEHRLLPEVVRALVQQGPLHVWERVRTPELVRNS